MTRRRIIVGLLAAVGLGLIVGLAVGEPRRVSVDVWLATATVWLAWTLIGELGTIAPVRAETLQGVGVLRRRRADAVDRRPRSLVNLEGLLVSALSSRRAAAIRLRPRLQSLADALLASRHGIDAAAQPERVVARLGDVAWIVDRGRDLDRPPTLTEVDRLVERLLAGPAEPGP